MNTLAAYRSALLRFDDHGNALYETDALLVTAPHATAQGVRVVHAVGSYASLSRHYAHLPVTHWPGRIMAPGFVDLHIHAPQLDVIGSAADGLLPWLENYTFPHESRFSDPQYCADLAPVFFDELLRNGVTTALTFATSHPACVQALFHEAQQRGLRFITGKVLQDRLCPDGVRDSTEQSLMDTETLLQRWHGVDRLGYAITPRFAATSSEAQLRGAGELACRYPEVWIQSHVAENRDEIAWVRQLFPQARSYLGVYDDMGLLRTRSVYAHCIHFDAQDRALMRERGAAAAVCPTSNLFLDSGYFDFANAQAAHMLHGLASDVGGGTSFSPFHTMLGAYYAGRESRTKQGLSLSPQRLWWLQTAGAAQALGLPVIGNLNPGCEADFIVLNPECTPLMARKTRQANTLDDLLMGMITLGDDRLIEKTIIAGTPRNG